MKMLETKPRETPESKFSTVEALLHGEAAVNWKERARERARKLASSNDTSTQDHMVPAGCNEQSLKAALKRFLKSYYPACAGRIQMNHVRNCLKKVKNAR